ncbi:MAG: class I SAM-dependent methyltransferase [Calditrichaeota bacterium]|nr:MAG: class I SAM-dependent methyltransferase [Calditrichota bacterium]
MKFKDHFSGHADQYARFRPTYPKSLFAFLAEISPGTRRAWDCATGNGQAAQALAELFEDVVATDASKEQLANAAPHRGLHYVVAQAEQTPLQDHTVDLVTVAQAAHWFHFDAFYREVRRVLTPGGILGLWGYDLLHITPEIDRLVRELYEQVDAFWPPERKWPEEHYTTLPFPFQELDHPAFEMESQWTLGQLLGYLNTWSATQRFIAADGVNPVDPMVPRLEAAWGEPERVRMASWPLFLRIGRV